MMKKLIGVFLLLITALTKAQVTVNVQLPPAGMVHKDQLWNLVLVNNNNNSKDVSISLDIRDAMSGESILSAVSRDFMLGKGIKMINIKDAQPVQYNYLAAGLTERYLPLGIYIACYSVFIRNEKKTEVLGDECVKINISPLSPPLLNMPADQTVLESNYPLFSWLPPSPVNMFDDLNYDLLLTEVLPGQSPAEAILDNVPIYTSNNLRGTLHNYPSSFSPLKEGQQYAWQITARNGLNYSAQTEVWSFSVKSADSARTISSSASYIILKRSTELSGITTVNSDNLLVKYYSFDRDHKSTIKFFSANGKVIHSVKQKISYGDNFLRFKLNGRFRKETVCIIEITDLQKNIYSASFSIQQQNNQF